MIFIFLCLTSRILQMSVSVCLYICLYHPLF